MVKNASDELPGYAPQNFGILNDVLYYKYDDGQNGIEYWRSDGTELGTYLLKTIALGGNGSSANSTPPIAIGDSIYFSLGTSVIP